MKPPSVVATTRPFFERATAIVDETWHDLDRMVGALERRVAELNVDSTERATLQLMTGWMRELARRPGPTQAELAAPLPAGRGGVNGKSPG